jgi:hypothetical protein
MKPTIGRIVHFNISASDDQPAVVRPAVVTAIEPLDTHIDVPSLFVFCNLTVDGVPFKQVDVAFESGDGQYPPRSGEWARPAAEIGSRHRRRRRQVGAGAGQRRSPSPSSLPSIPSRRRRKERRFSDPQCSLGGRLTCKYTEPSSIFVRPAGTIPHVRSSAITLGQSDPNC